MEDNIEKIKEMLSKIKSFKYPNISINDENKVDIFVKIVGDEASDFENTKEALSNIKDLEWQYLDGTGIFELTFDFDNLEGVILELSTKF